MGCEYKLIGVKTPFKSYQLLADYIALNYESFKNKDLSVEDIIFSDGEISILSKLLELKQDNKDINIEFNPNSGECDEKYEGFLALSDYIDKSGLILQYDADKYKKHLMEQYSRDRTPAEALELAELKIESDKLLGIKAAYMHRVVRAFFNGLTSEGLMILAFKEEYPISTIKSIREGLIKLDLYFRRVYGPDYKVVSGVTVTGNPVNLEQPIAGTIDLTIVDSNNRLNLYLLSISSKDDNTLIETRKLKKDYFLGFARHLLAKEGFNVTEASLNIIPILLVMNGGVVTDILFTEDLVEDRKKLSGQSQIPDLTWAYGKYFLQINERINIPVPPPSNNHILDDLREHTSKFFKDSKVLTTIYNDDVETVRKRKVKDSDDLSKGRYMIVNATDSTKNIYIRDEGSILEAVEKYIAELQEKSKVYINDFIASLTKVFNGDMPLLQLIGKSRNDLYLLNMIINFRHYIESGWKIIDTREDLKAAGIIALVNPSTAQVDFIALRSGILNSIHRLLKGETLLGAYLSDEESEKSKNVMKFTLGNATLMLIMDILNSDASSFLNFKIGTLKVVNPFDGTATIASTSELLTSYRRLAELCEIPNNLSLISIASDLDVFRNYIKIALYNNIFDVSTASNFVSSLETVDPRKKEVVLPILLLIRDSMEKKYKAKLGTDLNRMDYSDLVVFIYTLLCKTILYYEGVSFTQSFELAKHSGAWNSATFLNGTRTSNPPTIPDDNILRIVELARLGFHNMTQEITNNWDRFRDGILLDFWDAKGFTSNLNWSLGNLHHLYENFFVRNPDSSLNDRMLLKSPDDPSLKPEEKKFLTKWFEILDTYRYNSEDDKLKALQDGTYFELPLMEGNIETKVREIVDPVEYAKNEAKVVLNRMKEAFLRDETGVYTEDEGEAMKKAKLQYITMNRLSLTFGSTNRSNREKLLSLHNTNFWETNLELILAEFMFLSVRKKHMDKVLPAIKALRFVGQLYGLQTQIDMKNFDQYLEDYMTSHIHNLSILSEEERNVIGSVAPLKFIASTLAMGFNANTGLRNLLESLWKVPARISTKFYTKDDCFTMSEWGSAMWEMIKETPDFTLKVTLIEALNQRFRILDMDANRIGAKISSYKSGITHTRERLMFWFSVAPDYFNRMSMVIALMKHDGCWDACSFTKEHGFLYNWKKDKRFAIYASGNSSNPEYAKQRAEYLFLLRTYNEENETKLKEGDDIPLPYTTKLINALKDFSDSVFGFYDHDQRAMIERGAIASLFTQFKTYLTAARTVWFLAPKTYNKGETEQMINETTGKPMFLKIEKDAEGNEFMIPTDEDTGIPWIQEKNSYMEGIYYSLMHIYQDMKSLGWKGMIEATKNNKTRMNNLKMIGWHLLVAALLAGLMRSALAGYKEWTKAEALDNGKTMADVLRDQVLINGMSDLLGSFQDANIISSICDVSIDAEPAALSIISKFFTSTGDLLFGSKSFESWATTNIGMYRSGKVFIEGANEVLNAE